MLGVDFNHVFVFVYFYLSPEQGEKYLIEAAIHHDVAIAVHHG
jgi:hypothetical protein